MPETSYAAPARGASESLRADPVGAFLDLHLEIARLEGRSPVVSGAAGSVGAAGIAGKAAKRCFDVTVALVGLLVAAPILAICGVAVLLSSGWPMIFRQERLGLRGKPFKCLKFRTMVRNAEQVLNENPDLQEAYRNGGFKLQVNADPRVTRVGRFLRRTRLDELPQLWNVVRGDLSLVGPRPLIPEETSLYGTRRDEFLSVRPGVFGAWTLGGSNRPGYPERAALELAYIRTRSFGGDVKILLRHIPVLLSREKAEG